MTVVNPGPYHTPKSFSDVPTIFWAAIWAVVIAILNECLKHFALGKLRFLLRAPRSGRPGASFKVTGWSFPQLAHGTGVQLYFASTRKRLSLAGATAISIHGESPIIISSPACAVPVDSRGNFEGYFDVPNLENETYNAFLSFTPAGGTLTVSPTIKFKVARRGYVS